MCLRANFGVNPVFVASSRGRIIVIYNGEVRLVGATRAACGESGGELDCGSAFNRNGFRYCGFSFSLFNNKTKWKNPNSLLSWGLFLDKRISGLDFLVVLDLLVGVSADFDFSDVGEDRLLDFD